MSDKKISELSAVASINSTDVSVLVNSGTNYKFAFSTLLQFLGSNLSVGASITFGTTLPQNTSGKNGDLFINTVTGSFAQKIAGVWTIVYTLPATSSQTDGTVLYGLGQPGTSTGNNQDTYIDTGSGIFYKKENGTWNSVFSIQTGPQGPRGLAGTNGTNGTNGFSVLNGNVNPSNTGTGVNGDFYINTSNYTLFGPKTNGVWGDGVSLIPPGIEAGGTGGQVLVKASNSDYDTQWVNPLTVNDSSASNSSVYSSQKTVQLLALKQNALGFTPENISNKNTAGGYAGLDGSGKIAASLLPGYVDDVLEFASFSALPPTGETGKIYITLDDDSQYRWGGSAYVQLVASPGSTDAVPEGSVNLYFITSRVWNAVLNGVSFVSNAAVTATDTLLIALGKLQAQLNGLSSVFQPKENQRVSTTDDVTHNHLTSTGIFSAGRFNVGLGLPSWLWETP